MPPRKALGDAATGPLEGDLLADLIPGPERPAASTERPVPEGDPQASAAAPPPPESRAPAAPPQASGPTADSARSEPDTDTGHGSATARDPESDTATPGDPLAAPDSEQPAGEQPAAPQRAKLTTSVGVPVLDRAKSAVYWTPGLTLAALVEEALRREVKRREKHRGEPFPARAGALTPGPPVA